jgi:hypothetical protein
MCFLIVRFFCQLRKYRLNAKGSDSTECFKKVNNADQKLIFSRDGDKAFVVDPDKSIAIPKRLDFSNIKAKWFIPVVSASSVL